MVLVIGGAGRGLMAVLRVGLKRIRRKKLGRSYIFESSKCGFRVPFVRIHPTIGYDTFASVRGLQNISDTARVASAPSKHRIVVGTSKSG